MADMISGLSRLRPVIQYNMAHLGYELCNIFSPDGTYKRTVTVAILTV